MEEVGGKTSKTTNRANLLSGCRSASEANGTQQYFIFNLHRQSYNDDTDDGKSSTRRVARDELKHTSENKSVSMNEARLWVAHWTDRVEFYATCNYEVELFESIEYICQNTTHP